jgi:hypothetical protein
VLLRDSGGDVAPYTVGAVHVGSSLTATEILMLYGILIDFLGALPASAALPPDSLIYNITAANLARPGYLSSATDAALGGRVTRITDDTEFGGANVRHPAAMFQAWNADGTKIRLNGGILLDGRNYSFLKNFAEPFDPVWSNVDPNLVYGVVGKSLVKVDIVADVQTVIYTFSSYESIRLGGNLSLNDHYIVIAGKVGSDLNIVVYNLTSLAVHAQTTLAGEWLAFKSASMAQSDQYVVVDLSSRGVDAYALDLISHVHLTDVGGTGDVGIDAAGKDVYVKANPIEMYRLDNGLRISLTRNLYATLDGAVSCRNTGRPGWAYVTAYAPLQEVFAIKLDGSGIVNRFMQQHSASAYASVNAAGDRVLVASDWTLNNGTGLTYPLNSFLVDWIVANEGVFYVDDALGLDSYPGTIDQPWKTLDKARSTLTYGQTVYVRGGTYTVAAAADWQSVALNPVNSGLPGKPITFKVYPGETVLIRCASASPGGLIGSNGRNDIIWEGFDVLNSGANVSMLFFCHGVLLRKNKLHGARSATAANTAGVRGNDCFNCTIEENEIYDVHDLGDTLSAAAILPYYMRDSIVRKNVISDCGTAMTLKANPVVYLYGCDNVVFYHNYVHDMDGYSGGVVISASAGSASDDVKTFENVFENLKQPWVDLQSDVHYRNQFYNNTNINILGGSAFECVARLGATAKDERFYNNIFWHSSTGADVIITDGGSVSGGGGGEITIDYYVNVASGNDANPGTFTLPWQTMQKAVATATQGKTVAARGGTYTCAPVSYSSISLNPANSGADGAPITFRNYPGETPLIVPSSPSQGGLIGALGRNYITWRGFAVNNTLQYGAGFWNSDHGNISHCHIWGMRNPYVTDNCAALRTEYSSFLVFEHNTLHDSRNAALSSNGAAWTAYATNDSVFRYNDVYDVGSGVHLKTNVLAGLTFIDRNVFYRNYFHDFYGASNEAPAIMINAGGSGYAGDDNDVYENLIVNCQFAWLIGQRSANYRNKFRQNTVYNMWPGTDSGQVWIGNYGTDYDKAAQKNIEFYNNIFVSLMSYGLPVMRAWLWPLPSDTFDFCDYNCYFAINNDPPTWVYVYTERPLSEWISQGYDAHAVLANPLFVGATDYRLQVGSPCKGAGRNAVDMGAFAVEYWLPQVGPIDDSSGDTGGTTLTPVVSSDLHDYNCYYSPTGLLLNWIINYLSSPVNLTFTQWQERDLDGHSLNVNPLFLDFAGKDYRLQSGSPCRSSGFAGLDMGAFPYEDWLSWLDVPNVTSVAVPANGVYTALDELDFTVNWDAIIVVMGVPRISLDIGGVIKYANYVSGTGTAVLLFRYAVEAELVDANGISVGVLGLNGGTIQVGAVDASLTLSNVGSTVGVLVNSSAPHIVSVDVPAADTYPASSNMDFTVNWTVAVTVTGTPLLPLTLGVLAKNASYISGTGTTALLFRYAVEAGVYDIDGIGVGSALQMNGGLIQAGGVNADNTLSGIGSVVGILVGAAITLSVSVPANGTYGLNDVLNFTTNWDRNVAVTGTPRVELNIGGTTKYANYVSGSGTTALLFSYTVETGLTDSDGIGVVSLGLNLGTIKSGTANAALALNNVGSTTGVLVSSAGGGAPVTTSVAVPANATYLETQNLDFTVNWDMAVTVTGTPRVALNIGGATKYANYVSGTGTSALLFRYAVESAVEDANGIGLVSLGLNGGTIKSGATDANLALNNVGSTTAVLVRRFDYYVATNGSDTNNGTTPATPFATLAKAVTVVVAGDMVGIRGGTYTIANTDLSVDGTEANPIVYRSYPGETPIFSGGRIRLNRSWNILEGNAESYLQVSYAGSITLTLPGVYILSGTGGGHNIVRYVRSHHNHGNGFHVVTAHSNQFIDCYSDENYEQVANGGNSDGFAISSGTGNTCTRCTAYHNSDDGFDAGISGGTVWTDCVAAKNGYAGGNGNGFKFHLVGSVGNTTAIRCVAYGHPQLGFIADCNQGWSCFAYNCVAWDNANRGYSWFPSGTGAGNIVRNCIDYQGGQASTLTAVGTYDHNTWNLNITNPGFASLVEGNENFLKLAAGSDCINAGVDVGLPYLGTAPDLGAYERE